MKCLPDEDIPFEPPVGKTDHPLPKHESVATLQALTYLKRKTRCVLVISYVDKQE